MVKYKIINIFRFKETNIVNSISFEVNVSFKIFFNNNVEIVMLVSVFI